MYYDNLELEIRISRDLMIKNLKEKKAELKERLRAPDGFMGISEYCDMIRSLDNFKRGLMEMNKQFPFVEKNIKFNGKYPVEAGASVLEFMN